MDSPRLGQVITAEVQKDAIHMALAPMIAHEQLWPGQHVGLFEGKAAVMPNKIGIVDPFLTGPVFPGMRFWLMLYPNTVTGLRHEWEHPAFDGDKSKVDAERWLKEFAERADMGYRQVIEAGRNFIQTGDYFVQQDQESARNAIFENGALELFWKNYEIVTGEKVPDTAREGYVFSCSC